MAGHLASYLSRSAAETMHLFKYHSKGQHVLLHILAVAHWRSLYLLLCKASSANNTSALNRWGA